MSMIEKRLQSIREEIIHTLNAEEKSFLIDVHVAELLVEGFTELWEINKSDRIHAEQKLRKAMDHKFDRLAKKDAYCQKVTNRNNALVRENRLLREKVAKNERMLMGGQE